MMDKEELELKEKLKQEKKEFLEQRKRKKSNFNSTTTSKQKAIYLSNLPINESEDGLREELINECHKFGFLEKDKDGKDKCKLYRDEKGCLQGDALVIYSREEFATLAIEMLNGYTFKGKELKAALAQFGDKKTMKQNTDNKFTTDIGHQSKKKRKLDRLDKIPYDINENESRKDRTLILANIIDIYQDLESDELGDIEEDLIDGCKQFGTLVAHTMFPDKGEIRIVFEHRDDALSCRQTMNGRFFDGRKLLAFMMDEENLSEEESDKEETDIKFNGSHNIAFDEIDDNEDFLDDI